jgi:hypothetical protein
MANTLLEAMCGVRPVNSGRFIQEYVDKSLPHIGRKPSFLSPYILHLCHQYRCINEAAGDALTIAEGELVYKLGPEVALTEAGMDESSKDPVAPKPSLPDSHSNSRSSSLSYSGDKESCCPITSKRGQSQHGATVEEHQTLHLGASENPFQAGPGRVDQPA